MSNLVRNESIKLFANWINAISVTVAAAGVVAPIISTALELPASASYADKAVDFALICMCISAALHLAGQLAIGGLTDDK